MPNREHTNTCESVLSALENIRDMDQAAIAQQGGNIQHAVDSLAEWKRQDKVMDHMPALTLELAREWAGLYVMQGLSACDCDAKYVYVIARRWHRGHYTMAPAKVIARISDDNYVVEFLTPGPGNDQQGAMRGTLGVALDDIGYLGAMEIDYGPLLTS